MRPCGSPPGVSRVCGPYRLQQRLRERRRQGRSCFRNDRRRRPPYHGHGALVHHDQAGRRAAGVSFTWCTRIRRWIWWRLVRGSPPRRVGVSSRATSTEHPHMRSRVVLCHCFEASQSCEAMLINAGQSRLQIFVDCRRRAGRFYDSNWDIVCRCCVGSRA